ncbi:AAA family ATPase [Penicillium herquei]|nr:AAA family ATPase [Penicillium herquei]
MASRSEKLSRHLVLFEKNKRQVVKPGDAKLLLEALCALDDRLNCIERVLASPSLSNSLKNSFRVDLSSDFIINSATPFLSYIQHPAVESFGGGQFICQIVSLITEPPTFWNFLVHVHAQKQLIEKAELSFAWLLLQLVSIPGCASEIIATADQIVRARTFLNSPSLDIRKIGYRIDTILKSLTSKLDVEEGYRPGGRHDNDFESFREISILPSPDEITSMQRPFYRRMEDIYKVPTAQRPVAHYDNQFRLLREDFLAELRNDLQIARGQKKGRKSISAIHGLRFKGVGCGDDNRRRTCYLQFECTKGLPRLLPLPKEERKKLLDKDHKFMKHQAFGCLMNKMEIVGFVSLDRGSSELVDDVPILALIMSGDAALNRLLTGAKMACTFTFLLVNTPIFAYEPILQRLQGAVEFPMSEILLASEPKPERLVLDDELETAVEQIGMSKGRLLNKIIGTQKHLSLDESQLQSLLSSLQQNISIIQGPPGTGKSFIGALVAKTLHDKTKKTIMVICYTNHALDQFLEDLLDIGIPASSMVRLGSKSTLRTKDLGLFEQSRRTSGIDSWSFINQKREELEAAAEELETCFSVFNQDNITNHDMLEYLEFSDDSDYFDAFVVPESSVGMQRVGRGGEKVGKDYLWDAWVRGRDSDALRDMISPQNHHIWDMKAPARQQMVAIWHKNILRDRSARVVELIKKCDNISEDLEKYYYHKRHTVVLEKKRIIACTTNGAARYSRALHVANPAIVIVEEAGEILESHILTAMTLETKQLVLIGDHKQLRPKVNNYKLSVESGDGLDLNRSLFERLIAKGFPHTALTTQHRMRPEISRLVRQLTYPDLQDSDRTRERPTLRGFQNDVIFVNHGHPELELDGFAERRDPSMNTSKQNPFEVQMVLKVVKYLSQQGYGTSHMVILTPYLGQLSLLRTELSRTNDPILNDLDANDLTQAGLFTAGISKLTGNPIRISTIDNYQGEESDIVISSLTRSNEAGDIGFMAAPERVNVLLSRARNALVMIGNAATFLKSRKGHSTWHPLFEMLQAHGQVYDGFPLKCETHPERKVFIQSPREFEAECPDGGCLNPWYVPLFMACISPTGNSHGFNSSTLLPCGIHSCNMRCHPVKNHKMTKCTITMQKTCPKGHNYFWKCFQTEPKACPRCLEEAIEAERRREEDAKLEGKRRAIQLEHARQLAEIEMAIKRQRQRLAGVQDNENHRDALARKEEELKSLTAAADRINLSHSALTKQESSANTKKDIDTEKVTLDSAAREEWEKQKTDEGQSNAALDTLIDMIGLESVKDSFLAIKAKVDLIVRQGISLSDERFSASLLGNPGTGKTTVARLYAQFLSTVGVIPGSFFVETSGSKLASGGTAACQKHIDEIKSKGGGALFIDEAYQLTSGNNPGGSSVLDFLLAEIENLTGKVLFIIAGYNKNMEGFFAHNPGIPSRFPIELHFQDYSDEELRVILHHHMQKKYGRRMRVEEGPAGLYMRIVARRVGRGRGREGFGNARAVHNVFARILERQAKRLQRERRSRKATDDLFLTKEDLLGMDPRSVLKKNATWDKLQALTGLQSVKQSVQALFDTIQFNYQRELEEKPLVEFSLNKVFVGNPGTGKTTVAKLYGKLLADMGFLSNGEVVVKNPSDFIGNVIGGSEAATKGILASTLSKVLVIDEAYMLGGSSSRSDGGSGPDIYKTAVIDTLVAEVQSVPGDDRCVLLLGYTDAMERMFQTVNEGLSRRFPMSAAFKFEDFTDDDLQAILKLKIKQIGFSVTAEANLVVRQCLSRARNRPNFGNAGEVDILLDKAKLRHQQRLSAKQTKNIDILEPLDFDPDFDREQHAVINCRKLFEGVVGCEKLVAQLEDYQHVARNMKQVGLDARQNIPFNFLFRGPPGSGKTTTARRMGQVFYDMGILGAPEVVECSASDLVAQYVGQTGPKTKRLLEKGLGRVLFIDEAYRLADGTFGKEAMDELVDSLTKEEFFKKLIVVLAGYDDDINRLMASNPGLSSRFSETVTFQNLTASQCWVLMRDRLVQIDRVNWTVVQQPDGQFHSQILKSFEYLSTLTGWGNGRDINNVSDTIIRKVFACPMDESQTDMVLTQEMVSAVLETMIKERHLRTSAIIPDPQPRDFPLPTIAASEAIPSFTTASSTKQQASQSLAPEFEPDHPPTEAEFTDPRDQGVSDEVWTQLQTDRQRNELQKYRDAERLREEASMREKLDTRTDMPDDERRQYEENLRNLARERIEIEERKKREEEAQKKLQEIGACPVGFKWIQQATGYRCAGGSHFVSSTQLGLKN